MTAANPKSGPGQFIAWTLMAVAGAAGAWFSYGFGAQIGGVLIGVILALNGAAISALLTSSILARWTRRPPPAS